MKSFDHDSQDLQNKIRQQYDFLPYPESDLDYLPKDNLQNLFIHSLVTPYYLRYQQVTETKEKVILDAGCGSGLQSLILYLANPGAKIIGVDLSEKSVELARQRFEHHGFKNAEFYVLSLENIMSLGYEFDYINCDEVLYLLPNPAEMLQLFCSLLKPRGIIRANLHSYYQRNAFFRSQKAFRLLGFFDENPGEQTFEIIQETLDNLHENVHLKRLYRGFEQSPVKPNAKQLKEWYLVNFLLQGDKGYTIEQLFDFLAEANLDFLCMTNWRQWDITNLFKDVEALPLFWELGLQNSTEFEKLQLFELFNPTHRLLDFWAVQGDESIPPIAPIYWSDDHWLSCQVHLHPVLAQPKVQKDLLESIAKRQGFLISKYIPSPTVSPVIVDSLL